MRPFGRFSIQSRDQISVAFSSSYDLNYSRSRLQSLEDTNKFTNFSFSLLSSIRYELYCKQFSYYKGCYNVLVIKPLFPQYFAQDKNCADCEEYFRLQLVGHWCFSRRFFKYSMHFFYCNLSRIALQQEIYRTINHLCLNE